MAAVLGLAITLLVCLGSLGLGRVLLFRGDQGLDPAAAWGLSGLLGLGALGLISFGLGQVPGAFGGWGIYVIAVLTLIGLAVFVGESERPILRIPSGAALLGPLVIAIGFLFAMVSVLAPSNMSDWDTLAYHLAVPKIWLLAGRITYLPGIHHSNFPFTVDILNVWGLTWGGESGAKAFQLGFYLIGALAIFGLARQRYGATAGWLASAAFATVPVVMWEAGSGYIDLAHGLFAGCGATLAVLAAETAVNRKWLLPAGLLLGFAAGSKYTGLQMLAATGFVIAAMGFVERRPVEGVRQAITLSLLCVIVASPWYVKNVINTGNPVYPFFYERLGGANWDQRRADIYRNEQSTFGVARHEGKLAPSEVGHAVFGLAYQPGRYINPGQGVGMGTPLGAVGLALLAAVILWPLSGRTKAFEGGLLGVVAVSLLMWFVLSQQSRYIVPLAPMLAVLLGGLASVRSFRPIAAGMVGLQAVYSLWLVQTLLVTPKIQVATGAIAPDTYRGATIPFFEASQAINREVSSGKVALYDEVFGFLLDVPYFWANPGHSTQIPYDSMASGADYVRSMRSLGFTHVYVSLSPVVAPDRAFVARWLGSMGLGDPAATLSADETKALTENWETKWKVLIADAVRSGALVPQGQYRGGILLRFAG